MIAVLAWCDGFGNDTIVEGIFPTLEEAKAFAGNDIKGKVENYYYAYRWQAFDYGPVEFDWGWANDFE